MGYTIKYNGNKRKALVDAVNWLGLRRSKIIIKGIKSGASFNKIRFYCAFAGLQGYPVECLIDKYHPRMVRKRKQVNK